MVGNGDPVRVSPQVSEDLHGTAEGGFGIDDPVLTMQPAEETAELLRIGQGGSRPCAAKLLAPVQALQTGAKLSSKDAAQNLHRQKEGVLWAHPAAVVRRHSS